MSRPKFPDCTDCKWFLRGRSSGRVNQNPICRECDAGEFFEQRVSNRAPTDDELMSLYRSTYDE